MQCKVHVFDLETAEALIHLIVKHAYVQVGNNVYRQVNGIPMGASCSPRMCDMYLLSFEYDFFDRVITLFRVRGERFRRQRATVREILRAFAQFRRFLDDVFSLTQDPRCCKALMSNTQTFRGVGGQHIHGIYPTNFLPLNNTSLPDTQQGQFMDVEVRYSALGGGLVETKVYSKRSNNYFKGRLHLITVPSAHSTLYEGCKLGVITGQLVRFSYLCITVEPFIRASLDFCRRYMLAGYSRYTMLRRVYRVLPRVSPNFGITGNALKQRFRQEFGRTFPR